MSGVNNNDLEAASQALARLMTAAREVWRQTGILLTTADALFGKRGWKRASINPHDSSWTIDSAFESWMPNLAWRVYTRADRPNSIAFISVIHGDRTEGTRYRESLVSAGVVALEQPFAGLKQNLTFLNLPLVVADFPTDGTVQAVGPAIADPDKVLRVLGGKALARRAVEIRSKDELDAKVVSLVAALDPNA